MKKRLNRILSVALSVVLACSLFGMPTIAFASDAISDSPENGVITDEGTLNVASSLEPVNSAIVAQAESQDSTSPKETVKSNNLSDAYWDIDVTIIDARGYVDRDSAQAPVYTVTLTDNEVGAVPITKTLAIDETATEGGNLIYRDTYSFTWRSGQTYTVSVSDAYDEYAVFTQEITRPEDGRDFELVLYAGKVSDLPTDKAKGSIIYGDFNDDKVVDGKDAGRVIESIEGKTDATYDLRMDGGPTDLVDLQILAQQMGNGNTTSDNHAAAALGFDANKGDAWVSSGEVVSDPNIIGAGVTAISEDNLGDLVNNAVAKKVFAMIPSNNEPISESNPVSFEVNNLQSSLTQEKVVSAGESNNSQIANAAEEVMVQGMRITSSSVGEVTDGFVTAYYDDENGKEQSVMVPFSKDMIDASAMAAQGIEDAANPMGQPILTVPDVGDALTNPGTENYEDKSKSSSLSTQSDTKATRSVTNSSVEDGVIVINFGKLIAVKKVTLTFTKTEVSSATTDSLNLAAISSVEFLNDMASYVGEAEMDIPTNVEATSKVGKQFTVAWDRQMNVDGYEISIEALGKTEIVYVKQTNDQRQSATIQNFKAGKKGKVENNVEYTVKVQSVNQNWRSGWSDSKTVMPRSTKVPDAPEYITAIGQVRAIAVSWKAAEDADVYTIYYRPRNSSESWAKLAGIDKTSATVGNLADNTEYELYLTASNDIGESGHSATQVARTQSLHAAKMPSYKLINTQDSAGNYVNHITGAALGSTGANIVGNPTLDKGGNSVMCLFDNNSDTYFNVGDWDLGTSYNVGRHGVQVTFDTPQSIGFISFAGSVDNTHYSSTIVHYWDENNQMVAVRGCSMVQRDADNGRKYTLIQLPYEVKTNHIMVGVCRFDGGRGINMAEMRFHGYDSVYKEILDLFEDETQIQLVRKYATDEDKANKVNAIPETSEERTARLKPVMDSLKDRLETPDPVSGEEYPMKALAMKELEYAYQLLEDENAGLSDVQNLHSDLSTAYDSGKNLGISGLNAWQPLGRVAMAGETIVVYVNAPNASGKSKIDLYIGQHHGESSKAPRRVGTFNTGRTVFTIPESVFSTALTEHGGQLYAQYTGNNPNEQWSVRILGGEEIPTLDLFNVTDSTERMNRVNTYLDELSSHISTLESNHAEKQHKAGSSLYGYKDGECITNATDIMLDKIMYSIPAKMAWAASKNGDATRFLQALDGGDQMMELFYQHKGLMNATNDSGQATGATGTNVAPVQHLNIRYMTMFSGAFMYAAGNHIGIEYGSCSNIGLPIPVNNTTPGSQATEGAYFGWGMAHEIGHNINDGRYAYAEVTNNYFAQMAKSVNTMTADNPYGTTRFNYRTIFDHVTSGPSAHSSGVFTQLAMYWQLMLGYDNHELYTQYGTWDELTANRFFAQVDSYARNPQSFQGAVPLTFTSEQQNIMRLASAAAGKDLTDFFKAWGFVPDATTTQFMAQFAPETRALQYADETTAHRLEVNGTNANRSVLAGMNAINSDGVKMDLDGSNVTLTMTPAAGINADDIHGFEVSRISFSNGQQRSEVVGFVQNGKDGFKFTDDATSLGNRCVQYEIVAIDKHLNRSNTLVTNQVKLDGNGLYDSSLWTVTTNMETVSVTGDQSAVEDDEEPMECEAESTAATPTDIQSVLDSSRDYVGKASANPTVTIDMQNVRAVEHLVYTPSDQAKAINNYSVEVSSDGSSWVKVVEGTLAYEDKVENGKIVGKAASIYFPQRGNAEGDVDYINTENARFVRLTATDMAGKDVSFKSLLVYGPSGDNIEITNVALGNENDVIPAIGKLTEKFIYDQELYNSSNGKDGVIPANATVFTGSFTGNPAYNVVVLYNDRGEIVGGTETVTETVEENGKTYQITSERMKADQIILAAKPNMNQSFGQTSTGRWIYWITDDSQLYSGMKVRGELYRVDNAFTNEGQRLVSDCAMVSVKDADKLDRIKFSSDTANLKEA